MSINTFDFRSDERNQYYKNSYNDTSKINNTNYLNTNISTASILNKYDYQTYFLSSQLNEMKETEDQLETLKLKYQLIDKELSYTQDAYRSQVNDKKDDLYRTQLHELKLDLDSLNFSLYEK
jgi:hypothetical protein